MKRTIATTTVAMTLAFGMGLAAAQTKLPASNAEPPLSKNELQRLVSGARTPEEHHKIAAYYLQSADRLEQEASEHATLAKEYRANPPRLLKRQGANRTLVASAASHCDDFITFARKAAAAERALAAIHEKAAADATPTP